MFDACLKMSEYCKEALYFYKRPKYYKQKQADLIMNPRWYCHVKTEDLNSHHLGSP